MTEIERNFFEAFGIAKVQRCSLDSDNCSFGFSHKCSECYVDDIKVYPPITSDIVLGLVCIINYFTDTIVILNGYNIEQIKKEVLNTCLKYKYVEFVKEEVQELFRKE